MRVSSFAGMGKGVGIFMSVLLVAMPTLAQSNVAQVQTVKPLSDDERGALDGARDGQRGASVITWLAAGFLGGPGAIILAELFGENSGCYWKGCWVGFFAGLTFGIVSLFVPMTKPAPSLFVGKSAEYVDAYKKAFVKKVREKQNLYWLTYLIGNGLFTYWLFFIYSPD